MRIRETESVLLHRGEILLEEMGAERFFEGGSMRMFSRPILASFAALLLSFSTVFSQTNFWEPTNGPPGGKVNSIFVNSNGDVYVSTLVGIFRSVNNGQSWVQIIVSAQWPEVNAVTVSKRGALYAATDDYVYRSTDDGATWHQIVNGFPGGMIVSIVLNSNGDIFAGCSNGAAVYRSTDDGDSWTYCDNGLPEWVQAIVISPSGTLLVGTVGGVFRSTNNGDSWSQFNAGLSSINVRSIIVKLNGEIFAATGEVFRSTDDGKHWVLCDSSLGITALSVESDGILCGAAWDGRVYRSTDDGNSWVDISGNLGTQSTTSVAFGTGETIFLGTHDNGLFITVNSGAHWTQAGASNSSVFSLVVDPHDIIYSGSNNGIYCSTDHGNSWSPFALQGMSAPVFCISVSGTIFAPFPDSSLYRSTDGGKNWVPTSMGAFNLNSLVADPNGDIFAVEWRSGVFRSTDDGGTWTNIFSVPMWPPGMGPIVRSPLGILYLSYGSTIYRSADHGTTWQGVFEADQAFPFNSAIGGDLKGNVYAAIENGGVYFSPDSGSHWRIENSGLSRSTINGFASNVRGRVFAASDSGVFYHDGDSALWHQVNDGLTILQTTCIAVDSAGYVYAGTQGAGVFRSIVPTVLSVHEHAGAIPSTNSLEQNYPNPFNPTTRIQYNLASRGYVEINVYNILGQLVRNLVQAWKNPGEYFVDFNATGLASGMYIYRLRFSGETASFTRAKLMMVLK